MLVLVKRFRKSDIETYGYPALPAVNVKVHFPRSFYSGEMAREVEADSGEVGFAAWWSEADRDEGGWLFQHACENEAETFDLWENSGDADYAPSFPDYSGAMRFSYEGRSGGWLVVRGLPEVESWDAVMVSRWARFARVARDFADGVPYSMMMSAAINEYACIVNEREAREQLCADIAADAELSYQHA